MPVERLSALDASFLAAEKKLKEGQVRVLVHTQRWTPTSPTPFSTWGDLMKLVYTAP